MKTADISDERFLDAVDEALRLRGELEGGTPWTFATRWDVAAVLAGHPEGIGTPFESPDIPEKILLSKARRLIRRGLLEGCACGCRGEFSRATHLI